MQVQFQTVLFDSEDFRFAVVNGDVLTIVTKKGDLDLKFASEDDALDAQVELGEVLDSAKGGSLSSALQEAATVVSDLFGSLLGNVGTVKRTVRTKAAQAKATTQTFEERARSIVGDLADQLEKALDPAGVRGRSTAQDSEDVFGSSRSAEAARARTVDANAVVHTLSDAELRLVIDEKAEQLIATDRRVQNLVSQLRQFHTESEVQETIREHKEMVFRTARNNDHLTVNEVFNRILG